MYVASRNPFGDNWHVRKQYSCANGLSAWFIICVVPEPAQDEVQYTDGAISTAQQNAERIVEALNK